MSSSKEMVVPPLSTFKLSGLSPLTRAQQAQHLEDVASRFTEVRAKFGSYEVGEIYDTPFNGPQGSTTRQLQDYAPSFVASNAGYTLRTKLFHKWGRSLGNIPNELRYGLPAYSMLFYGMTATGRWIVGECDFMEFHKPKSLFSTDHVRLQIVRLTEPSSTEQFLEMVDLQAEIVIWELFRHRLALYRESLEAQSRKVDTLEQLLVASDLLLRSHEAAKPAE